MRRLLPAGDFRACRSHCNAHIGARQRRGVVHTIANKRDRSTNSHLADKADLVFGSISAWISFGFSPNASPMRRATARRSPVIMAMVLTPLARRAARARDDVSRSLSPRLTAPRTRASRPRIDDRLDAVLKYAKAFLIEGRSHHLRHSTVPSPNRTIGILSNDASARDRPHIMHFVSANPRRAASRGSASAIRRSE